VRSVIIMSLGLILWALCLAAAKFFGILNPLAKRTTTLIFIVLWFILSAVNLYYGTQAGYTVTEELPIFLMIFLIPSSVAFIVQRKFS
jgi:hypothetical protein